MAMTRLTLVLFLLMLSGSLLFSASAKGVPHVFVSGEQAKAEQVNENFSNLEARILALENASVISPTPDPGDPVTGVPGTPDPSGPASVDDGFYYAYVEDGVLKSANLAPGSIDPSDTGSSYKLVDANNIVLRFIASGSLNLPQDFVVYDYDAESTKSYRQTENYFAAHVVVGFTAAADGSIAYSSRSFLSDDVLENNVTLYYESIDCSGQAYIDANYLRTDQTVYNLNGEWVRLPVYDSLTSSSSEGITAKSKTNNAQTVTVSNPGSCIETNELVNQAVIPLTYDPEPILSKITAPVRVEAPTP